jgi:hypothetical protein
MLENLLDPLFVLNIRGRIGENIARLEKLKNQRREKTKRGKPHPCVRTFFPTGHKA